MVPSWDSHGSSFRWAEDSHLTSMGWRNTPSCNAWDKAGPFPRAVSGLNKQNSWNFGG